MKSQAIFENLLTISISDINKYLLLNRPGKRSKTLLVRYKNSITGKYETTSSFQITANIEQDNDFLQLDYFIQKKRYKKIVPLIASESNLGSGLVYWFKCPITGYKSLKLYFNGDDFISRRGLNNILYKRQQESKKKRRQLRTTRTILKCEELIKSSQKKYFMAERAGYPTRKQLKVIKAKRMLGVLCGNEG